MRERNMGRIEGRKHTGICNYILILKIKKNRKKKSNVNVQNEVNN